MTSAAETLGTVRRAVRSVVNRTAALRDEPELRRRIAEKMVGVSLTAAELLDEDRRITEELASKRLARAQAAGGQAPMAAVNNAASTFQRMRDAIDFPTYVQSLITGVFTAITFSTLAQLEAFADLMDGVTGASPAMGPQSAPMDAASRWIQSHFDVFNVTPGQGGNPPTIDLREGSDLPDNDTLKSTLDATDDEVSSIDTSDLTGTLLPLVRRHMSRNRQKMLATMVLMGMQRIVVDEGKLHASMEMAVDARSIAEQTQAEQTKIDVSAKAGANWGWGSASLSTNVGYVKSDKEYSKEELAVRAGLRAARGNRVRRASALAWGSRGAARDASIRSRTP